MEKSVIIFCQMEEYNRRHVFGQLTAYFIKEQNCVTKQMLQCYSDHSDKKGENIPSGRTIPFDFLPETTGFSIQMEARRNFNTSICF